MDSSGKIYDGRNARHPARSDVVGKEEHCPTNTIENDSQRQSQIITCSAVLILFSERFFGNCLIFHSMNSRKKVSIYFCTDII